MQRTEKVTGPLRYRHIARISGSGEFPLDMLRYDRCYPYTETDSSIIHTSIQLDINARVSDWTVLVMQYSELKDWQSAWTFGRWKSFCCRVDPPLEGVGVAENQKGLERV